MEDQKSGLTTKIASPALKTAVIVWGLGLIAAAAGGFVASSAINSKKIVKAGTLYVNQSYSGYYSVGSGMTGAAINAPSSGLELLPLSMWAQDEPILVSKIRVTVVASKGDGEKLFPAIKNVVLAQKQYNYDDYGYGYYNYVKFGSVESLIIDPKKKDVAYADIKIQTPEGSPQVRINDYMDFIVLADIGSIASNASVNFQIAKPADVSAIGEQSNRAAAVKINNATGNWVKIIAGPSITVLSPKGGEKWEFGKSYDITWKATNITADPAYIYLWFSDGGLCQIGSISPVNSGKYSVKIKDGQQCLNIPKNITAGSYKIMIAAGGDEPQASGSSDNFFTIGNVQSISGVEPSGRETFEVGQTMPIRWHASSGIGSVDIGYRREGSGSEFNLIKSSVLAASGQYSWKIPSSVLPAESQIDSFVIIVAKSPNSCGTGDCGISSRSGASFTIAATAVKSSFITVSNPNGGETLKVGQTYKIKWTTSKDIGAKEKIIIGILPVGQGEIAANDVVTINTENKGFYDWKVPVSVKPGKYLIEIAHGTMNEVRDESNAPFSIVKK